MKKLLVVVDMQNDFIDGSLGTKEAVAIVPQVVNKIKQYRREGSPIIVTMDTHSDDYLSTQEGKHLPVSHCIKDSEGWKLNPEVLSALEDKQLKTYEKPTFGSTEFSHDLSSGMYDDITTMEFVGLCTDICVISNVLLAKAHLLDTTIQVDASCCAGVTPESHENALKAMEMCQIDVIR